MLLALLFYPTRPLLLLSRCGFDLELQLAWKAVPQPGATEVRGHCK